MKDDANGGRRPKPGSLSGRQAAHMLLLLIQGYAHERDKDVSRLRISKASIIRLALRQNWSDKLERGMGAELAEWGWTIFPLGVNEFGLVKTVPARKWLKLGSKRLTAERRALRRMTPEERDERLRAIALALNFDLADDDEEVE